MSLLKKLMKTQTLVISVRILISQIIDLDEGKEIKVTIKGENFLLKKEKVK